MACHMAPVGSNLTEHHLDLTDLLGCTEYSQGSALLLAVNGTHTLCKACSCPSGQGALRTTEDSHVPGVQGMQHVSLQPRMQLGRMQPRMQRLLRGTTPSSGPQSLSL